VLPLLSQKKYYQNLKYGYARGSEPVKYVDSIYDFRDILENYFAPATTPKEAL
jgi:membrane-bound lytic murein transglycosylase F